MTNTTIILNKSGAGSNIPPRLGQGLLSVGGGMFLLYGGVNPQGLGNYADLWHLRVHKGERDLHCTEAKYKDDHEHYILSWRQGFSLHFIKNSQDPVMVGGTFGNNQQNSIMMSIPEIKCKGTQEYLAGNCIPCPKGSVVTPEGQCDYCDTDEYFDEEPNFFASTCKHCPLGTVGGQGEECVPCSGGYIWREDGTCKLCSPDKIYPIGTRYEFSDADFGTTFLDKREDNLPKIFDPEGEATDRTATVVIVALIFLSIVLAAIIGMVHNACKEKSLFIFRELDIRAITGGETKKFVGGVIICFYALWVLLVAGGFMVNFFAFNSRTDFSEVTDLNHNHYLPSSFDIQFHIYYSYLLERPV